MNKYTIPCTEEQTRKALELGAPIEFEMEFPVNLDTLERSPYPDIKMGKDGEPILIAPTAEEMIGWLEEQRLCIDADWTWDGRVTMWVWDNTEKECVYTSNTNSRQEATLASIDAALDYLIKNKK